MKRSVVLSVCAITTALTLITSFFPFVFFVPVLVAITLGQRRISIYGGVMFGVVSFLYSYIRPSIVSEYFMRNPLLPIVPRVIAAILAHYAYKGVYAVSKQRVLSAGVCAIVGSVSNTVFVMMGLSLFTQDFAYSGIEHLLDAILVVVGTSALIEIFVNLAFVTAISTALYKSGSVARLLRVPHNAETQGSLDIVGSSDSRDDSSGVTSAYVINSSDNNTMVNNTGNSNDNNANKDNINHSNDSDNNIDTKDSHNKDKSDDRYNDNK